MCIRDRPKAQAWTGGADADADADADAGSIGAWTCLLYTSDAADERSSVDLGGRRIIKKKNQGAL